MGLDSNKTRGRGATVASVVGITLVGIALYAALLAWLSQAPATDLDRAIGPVRLQSVELQVAIHDLVEQAGPGTVVAVCRALASKSVTLDVTAGARLGDVLEEVASQVHTDLIVRGGVPGYEVVPTLSCPAGTGDYLQIGHGRGSP